MTKVTHKEADKMRYTMKTNARRALKTRYGQAARDLAEQLIHEDAVGFYIIEREVLKAVKAAEAPTATAATAEPVLKAKPAKEYAEDGFPVLSGQIKPKAEWVELFEEPTDEEWEAAMHKEIAAIKPEPKASVPASTEKCRCATRNGARKPLKGKTADVWAMGDKLLAELGRTPELKDMKAAMPSYSATTVAIQFYAWRKFNNLDK
ncbi:hypothetical protein [Hafnia phage yong3]|nr:hypothetical protein [Hafnia phage yong3]UPT53030.1 hypothetical protein [Hafnia phage yong3]